jgi:hypothetical protein
MKLAIHKDILLKLLSDEKEMNEIFSEAQSQEWEVFASKELYEQMYAEQQLLTGFEEPFETEHRKMVEDGITFLEVDQTSETFSELIAQTEALSWVFTVMVAIQSQAAVIWTDLTSPLPLKLNLSILSTEELRRTQAGAQILSVSTESLEQTLPEEKYKDYGAKADFHWMEDNRRDPMFYERFLHFYGLKCLTDGKTYYLNPEEGDKLALPDPNQLDAKIYIFKISAVDTGVEDSYAFELAEVNLDRWKFYWQLFLEKTDSDEFEEGGEALNKKENGRIKWVHLSVVNEKYQTKPPPKKFTLNAYNKGSDIFTTGLGFSEFSLPKDYTQMTISETNEYFGIDLKILDDECEVLKIGKQIFSILMIEALNQDCYHEEITKENREEWQNDYDLSFEAEK